MPVLLDNRSSGVFTSDGTCLLPGCGQGELAEDSTAAAGAPVLAQGTAVPPLLSDALDNQPGKPNGSGDTPLPQQTGASEQEVLALAHFVLGQEQVDLDLELSLSLVNEAEIATLNRCYRGISRPTDVLSFECDPPLLGDVVLCPKQALKRAEELNTDFAEEVRLLTVHGILHLLGYDHDNEAAAKVMETREDRLLMQWRALRLREQEACCGLPAGNVAAVGGCGLPADDGVSATSGAGATPELTDDDKAPLADDAPDAGSSVNQQTEST
ncbi:MAG: rRNA maturation RNase YbeY [Coriobacteriales bacterium]|jgi:probable rRNA maturation factor|nr:rRNA maturation RNase YbeY [Coriobacteriales bacterium]